jgi:hypothetical protein
LLPVNTAARITAFSPGQSPPLVKIPTLTRPFCPHYGMRLAVEGCSHSVAPSR